MQQNKDLGKELMSLRDEQISLEAEKEKLTTLQEV